MTRCGQIYRTRLGCQMGDCCRTDRLCAQAKCDTTRGKVEAEHRDLCCTRGSLRRCLSTQPHYQHRVSRRRAAGRVSRQQTRVEQVRATRLAHESVGRPRVPQDRPISYLRPRSSWRNHLPIFTTLPAITIQIHFHLKQIQQTVVHSLSKASSNPPQRSPNAHSPISPTEPTPTPVYLRLPFFLLPISSSFLL